MQDIKILVILVEKDSVTACQLIIWQNLIMMLSFIKLIMCIFNVIYSICRYLLQYERQNILTNGNLPECKGALWWVHLGWWQKTAIRFIRPWSLLHENIPNNAVSATFHGLACSSVCISHFPMHWDYLLSIFLTLRVEYTEYSF